MSTRLSATAVLMMLAHTAQGLPPGMPYPFAGDTDGFAAFAARVASIADSNDRAREVNTLLAKVHRTGTLPTLDSTVTFLYRGKGHRVSVAGDPNGWDPRRGEMKKLPGTDLFFLSWTLDPAARFEYKLVIDSTWILDTLNPLRAAGGFGFNSEVRMPRYRFPSETLPRSGIAHGSVDTVSLEHQGINHGSPILVYLPAGYRSGKGGYPVLYVTDGGEFLTLARMDVVLDNLIAEGQIQPLIAVFMDPRSNPPDPGTSTRMTDYAMNDAFVRWVADEVRPALMRRFRMIGEAAQTGIMGCSMGGLISTYAALTRPDVFGLCGALSPSYQWEDDRLIGLIRHAPGGRFRMFLGTGTIRDAQARARIVRDLMRGKGYDIVYTESPESHNWVNWSGKLGALLGTFWGAR